MNSCHLRKDEVEYELKIRGISDEGTAAELRKRLAQCFSNNTEVVEEIVHNLYYELELEQCDGKVSDLSSLVKDYKGDFQDTEYQRIVTRLTHVHLRIQRITIPDSLDEGPEKTKRLLLKKIMALMDSFRALGLRERDPADREDTTSSDEAGREDDLVISSKRMPIQQPLGAASNVGKGARPKEVSIKGNVGTQFTRGAVEQQREPLASQFNQTRRSAVPVYKWGLTYENAAGQSVGAFLQRVEEIRRARGLSKFELFESAVDLFAGPALVWYRSTLSRIRSWEELCREMKIVFQSPDYDFRLQQEIFNRVQGEHEPIDMYIAAVEGLYGRLADRVPEGTRLAQMMNNLHPHLQDRLALFEIRTLEELRFMGRRAEAGRLRASIPRVSPRGAAVLEPDLAYMEPSRRRGNAVGHLASLHQSSRGPSNINCWNCGLIGHRYSACRKARTTFCYGCGARDVFKVNCSRCNPKNL